MEDHIEEFLQNKMTKVMLILGVSGSGKSLFGQYYSRQAWDRGVVPLWISLPGLANPKGTAIEEGLQLQGVPENEIETFRGKPLLIILDAYDEVKNLENLYENNQLESWPNAKVIITCRLEYLPACNYDALFKPKGGAYCKRYVAPFSPKEIESYLKKYVQQQKVRWSVEEYQQHFDRLPAIKELIQTPFLLRIIADVLPDIVEGQEEVVEQIKLTRRSLYEKFIDQWFIKHLNRWEEQGKLSTLDEGLKLDEDFAFQHMKQRLQVLRDYPKFPHLNQALGLKQVQKFAFVFLLTLEECICFHKFYILRTLKS